MTFLSSQDIINNIYNVSSHFKQIVDIPWVLGTVYFNSEQIPHIVGYQDFLRLDIEDRCKFVKDGSSMGSSGRSEKMPLVAYYTDGGLHNEDMGHFINHLYDDNSQNLYWSTNPNCVYIKSSCFPHVGSKYQFDPKSDVYKSKSDPHIYQIPLQDLQEYEPNFENFVGFLQTYDLTRNSVQGKDSFYRNFMLFTSMHEISIEEPIVQIFNGVTKQEEIEEMGFTITTQQDEQKTKFFEFDQNTNELGEVLGRYYKGCGINGVYPVSFGIMQRYTWNYVCFRQPLPFKYLLMKYSNATNEGKGDEDDDDDGHHIIFNISAYGSITYFRTSNED